MQIWPFEDMKNEWMIGEINNIYERLLRLMTLFTIVASLVKLVKISFFIENLYTKVLMMINITVIWFNKIVLLSITIKLNYYFHIYC
jgi:hypothetical protein